MTLTHCAISVGLLIVVAPPALACSVSRIPTPAELGRQAEAIVRARAERLSSQPGSNPDALAASATQVEFQVVAVLKGTLPTSRITFNGELTARDDPNDRPVPYDVVRPGGRGGECFALGYRQGAEYLLFLKRASHRAYAQPDLLTPYWAPLTPSNEQLASAKDPWEAWVRARLR